MSEEQVFCRLNESYWGELSENGESLISLQKLHVGDPQHPRGLHVLPAEKIKNIFGIGPEKRGDFQCYYNDEVLAFQPAPQGLFLGSRTNPTFEFVARQRADSFFRKSSTQILQQLSEPDIGIDAILNSLKAYTYSDHFSLWLFNPDTDFFTIHSASFTSEVEYVHKDDPGTTLFETIKSKQSYQSRSLKPKVLNSGVLGGIKTVNRFYINFSSRIGDLGGDSDLLAVLSLYSRHPDFAFQVPAQALISHIVQLRLTKDFSIYASWYNKLVKNLTENYVPGKLDEFLKGFVAKITKTLGFESASVFFSEPEHDGALVLRAISEFENNTVGVPAPRYKLTDKAKTVKVYKDNTIGYSYSISTDSENSKIFSERTEHPPKNWIGVPITRSGAAAEGVLRAKNRRAGSEIKAFNKADIDILKGLSSIIAYLHDAESDYLAKKQESEQLLKEQEQEYRELSDFLRTYRHEIKSPLIVVTEASTLLKIALKQEQLITGDELPKKVRAICNDLDMVGQRLTFIANVLTFDPAELVKDIRPTNPFFEIVTPVLAFMKHYAKNRGKDILIDKDSLRLATVKCDSISASMVFNIMLDNAVKYTPKGGTIKVYGQTLRDHCSVIVENRGLQILEDDIPHLFQKYYRGKMPIQQKTEGSGIGLYLAQEIMKINEGAIILRKANDPTTFELRLKQYHAP